MFSFGVITGRSAAAKQFGNSRKLPSGQTRYRTWHRIFCIGFGSLQLTSVTIKYHFIFPQTIT